MAFKPFGLEERAPIPDSVRRDGFKSFGTKGFPGPYYNSAIFEASQDHVLGTQAQVTLGQATCYYAATADFRDKDNAVVTFVAYDRINIVIDQMERDIVFPAVKLEFIAHSLVDMNSYDISIPGDCSGRIEGTNTSATVSVITITGTSSLLKVSGDAAVDDSGAGGKVMINGLFRVNWTSATLLGSGLSIAGISIPVITKLTSTDVAFIDDALESLRTYRFNGSTWSQVGSGLSISGVGSPSLTTLSATDIALIDNSIKELRTYRFNGSTWSQVGSGLSIPSLDFTPALAGLNSTDVAFIYFGTDELRTYRFNGSTWSQVGSSLSIAGSGATFVESLNSTDIAFIDNALNELRTYRFNGSTWSQVGIGLSITGINNAGMARLNSEDIAFIEANTDQLRTYRFNGYSWEQIGTFLSISGTGSPWLSSLTKTDVAFIDGSIEELRTYRFDYLV